MRTTKKTALALMLGTTILASPALAHAGHWRPYPGRYFPHAHFHVPAPLIGLGIAGAVLGTAALVDSIVRPRIVYAPPPPPNPYDDAYRRGYERGREDAYDDGYRRPYDD